MFELYTICLSPSGTLYSVIYKSICMGYITVLCRLIGSPALLTQFNI
jgi:hypothetical protein